MRKRLNLGCGRDYIHGWTNVDRNETIKADLYFDLEAPPWPLISNSYDQVLIKHVLEHITHLTPFMEELYRITSPNALIEVHTPFWNHHWSVSDPDHKRIITVATYSFYSRSFAKSEASDPNSPMTPMNANCNFEVVKTVYNIASDCWKWFNELDKEAQLWSIKHLCNVADVMTATLRRKEIQ